MLLVKNVITYNKQLAENIVRALENNMANQRDFSDSIKLEVIKNNLKKNSGSICCEICGSRLNSIEECHFDHIYPYAKGGKSTLDNCQILCEECNLRKNDKVLQDFMLEEKAKQFLSGVVFTDEKQIEEDPVVDAAVEASVSKHSKTSRMTKEHFDEIVKDFIDKNGDIHTIDFARAYNNLPSAHYVKEYYGNLNNLKKKFNIADISFNWNRETIKQALEAFVAVHGDISEKDFKKKNGLPSVPCIMNYYPEYTSVREIKKGILGLSSVHTKWTKEECLEAGHKFVERNGKITEKDCTSKNGLPNMASIYRHFGTISAYQLAINAPVSKANEYITKEMIEEAVIDFFGDRDRVIASRSSFFGSFKYTLDLITKKYTSFDVFCEEMGITVLKVKKPYYSKKEVDDAIHNWIFSGKNIPKSKELTSLGLPSSSSIMKFYQTWREPFVLYKKIYDEANRNK